MATISEVIDNSQFTGLEEFDEWGSLGDYRSSIETLFGKIKKQGIFGVQLNWVLQQFLPIAKQSPDVVRYPFMYELDSRPELKSDDKVPNWLIDQIKDRVIGAVGQTMAGSSAEAVAARVSLELDKGTGAPAKAVYAPGATDLVMPASAKHGGAGRTDWVTYALIGGAVLAAGVVVWLLMSKDEPAPRVVAPALPPMNGFSSCGMKKSRKRR